MKESDDNEYYKKYEEKRKRLKELQQKDRLNNIEKNIRELKSKIFELENENIKLKQIIDTDRIYNSNLEEYNNNINTQDQREQDIVNNIIGTKCYKSQFVIDTEKKEIHYLEKPTISLSYTNEIIVIDFKVNKFYTLEHGEKTDNHIYKFEIDPNHDCRFKIIGNGLYIYKNDIYDKGKLVFINFHKKRATLYEYDSRPDSFVISDFAELP